MSGQLRVYLGAAPGVGKTYTMLEEGHRRLARGTDVVVGFVETHGRPHTAALVEGFEVVPRATIAYRGAQFTELDVAAVLARTPEVALVDELAHTNVPGSRNAKRWQDVQELLDAGITVITTVNVQHLESLNDVVQQITGVVQRETVPDAVVRAADQIELVDMAPEALRRRMAHGNVYPADRIDASLGNYFRVGNLTALRELALLWVADKVDEQLDRYRAEHRIEATWEARERVVVALTGGPEGDTLVRRAARIAARTKGADLLAVHVARNDGLADVADSSPAHLARQRILVESMGGTYHQVVGGDVSTALLDFARAVNATQLVLGASRRGRLAQVFSRGVGVTTTAGSGPIDVHLVTHEQVSPVARRGVGAARRNRRSAVGRRRSSLGFAVALLGMPLLTLLLDRTRGDLSLASEILVFLLAVVAVALLGGLFPALVAAGTGFVLLNYFFTPPVHRFAIASGDDVVALVAFLVVAAAVSTVVDLAARRTRDAARARAEAQTLATVAGSVLRGSRPLPALLDQLREAFSLTGVTLLRRRPDAHRGPQVDHDPQAWEVVGAVGDQPCAVPGQADSDVRVDVALPGDVAASGQGAASWQGVGREEGDLCLALRGHPLDAADRRVVEAFAAQAALALRQERLAEQAAAVGPLAETDRLRTALLNAVSHDLRTPLATARAAVDGLRSNEIQLGEADRAELLAAVDDSLLRLTRLVDDLLDMSRLQVGVLALSAGRTDVAEVVRAAVHGQAREVAVQLSVDLPADLPDVHADAALLERALANLLSNAVRHSPPGRPVTVEARERSGWVELRVVDHGPGVPAVDRDTIFLPFQRLGDHSAGDGVGLGLALSRGLVEAMGGTLTPEATDGGGLTMTVALPVAV